MMNKAARGRRRSQQKVLKKAATFRKKQRNRSLQNIQEKSRRSHIAASKRNITNLPIINEVSRYSFKSGIDSHKITIRNSISKLSIRDGSTRFLQGHIIKINRDNSKSRKKVSSIKITFEQSLESIEIIDLDKDDANETPGNKEATPRIGNRVETTEIINLDDSSANNSEINLIENDEHKSCNNSNRTAKSRSFSSDLDMARRCKSKSKANKRRQRYYSEVSRSLSFITASSSGHFSRHNSTSPRRREPIQHIGKVIRYPVKPKKHSHFPAPNDPRINIGRCSGGNIIYKAVKSKTALNQSESTTPRNQRNTQSNGQQASGQVEEKNQNSTNEDNSHKNNAEVELVENMNTSQPSNAQVRNVRKILVRGPSVASNICQIFRNIAKSSTPIVIPSNTRVSKGSSREASPNSLQRTENYPNVNMRSKQGSLQKTKLNSQEQQAEKSQSRGNINERRESHNTQKNNSPTRNTNANPDHNSVIIIESPNENVVEVSLRTDNNGSKDQRDIITLLNDTDEDIIFVDEGQNNTNKTTLTMQCTGKRTSTDNAEMQPPSKRPKENIIVIEDDHEKNFEKPKRARKRFGGRRNKTKEMGELSQKGSTINTAINGQNSGNDNPFLAPTALAMYPTTPARSLIDLKCQNTMQSNGDYCTYRSRNNEVIDWLNKNDQEPSGSCHRSTFTSVSKQNLLCENFIQNQDNVCTANQIENVIENVRNKYGSNIYNPNVVIRKGLRTVVIDGSNVALGHTNGRFFSVKGLKICIDYFRSMGHTVRAFVPHFRLNAGESSDPGLLNDLSKEGVVIFTPSRVVQGRRIVPYDDRFIVQYAAACDGIIVSNDSFKDVMKENPTLRPTIEQRLLMFTWVDDMIIFPPDPMGQFGPSLDEFLRFP